MCVFARISAFLIYLILTARVNRMTYIGKLILLHFFYNYVRTLLHKYATL